MARQLSDSQASVTWQSRMRDFVHRCAESATDEQADRILEALKLMRFADALAWGAPPAWPQADEMEAMLSAGAYENAAMALLGPEVGFMLSRGAHGICLATVVLPGSENEVTAEGGTLALALLTAMASALLDYADQYPLLVASLRVQDVARHI